MTAAETGLAWLRAQRIGVASIHEASGMDTILDPAIRPIDPSSWVAGPACTAQCEPGDNLAIHRAVLEAPVGSVLVVDYHGDTSYGPWGDLLAHDAIAAGLGGLVIDGAIRDSAAIRALGFPVFARGRCVRGTTKKLPGLVGTPITCGGVLIRPGDLVVGDADGVVVVPATDIDEVLGAARRREAQEATIRARIEQGERLGDLLGLREPTTSAEGRL